jgi:cation transport ATPase
VVSVSLAMMGYIHPLIAALLMPVSSITVLTIALRGGLFAETKQQEVIK